MLIIIKCRIADRILTVHTVQCTYVCTLVFHLGKDMYLHTWYVVKRTLLVRYWPVLSAPQVHLQSVLAGKVYVYVSAFPQTRCVGCFSDSPKSTTVDPQLPAQPFAETCDCFPQILADFRN